VQINTWPYGIGNYFWMLLYYITTLTSEAARISTLKILRIKYYFYLHCGEAYFYIMQAYLNNSGVGILGTTSVDLSSYVVHGLILSLSILLINIHRLDH